MAKNPPASAGNGGEWVQSLGRDDPLKKGMATHCRILAWRIPWTEKPGGLQSTGLRRVRHNQAQHADSHEVYVYMHIQACIHVHVYTHIHRERTSLFIYLVYRAVCTLPGLQVGNEYQSKCPPLPRGFPLTSFCRPSFRGGSTCEGGLPSPAMPPDAAS